MTPPSRRHVTLVAPSFDPSAGGIQACSRFVQEALEEIPNLHLRISETGSLVGRGKLARFFIAAGIAAATMVPRGGLTWVTHPGLGAAVLPCLKASRRELWVMVHGIEVFDGVSPRLRTTLQAASRILCVSLHTANRLTAHLPEVEERIAILPNTFDEATFTPARVTRTLERYGIDQADEVILSVGRLAADERYKGFDRLIEALPAVLEKRPTALLVLAGKGDDADRLRQLATERGVAERVRFTGFVPEPDLVMLFRRCEVFAMPSTGEGFGIVFLQALGCGKPVIAGNCDGSVDALAGGEFGTLVDPFSTDEIAQALERDLARATESSESFDTALRDKVVAEFGRKRYRERIAELLEGRSPCVE